MEGKAGCFHLCVVCNVSSSLSPTETGCDLNELDEDKVQLELWEILYNYVLGFDFDFGAVSILCRCSI